MATTARGHIEQQPSGSFRVRVYAGTDPVTGKERRLKQTCPDEATAAAALGRLLSQAVGDRFPDREATLGQALDKYLEVADLEVSTREAHEGYIRRTIRPVLGNVKVRKLGADSLDALYTALKKCSRLCGRLPRTEHSTDDEHSCDQWCRPLHDHRTTRPHACDSRCRPHVCRPMKPATILRIHSVISSALDLAVRYEWAERNVAKNARPPHPRKRVVIATSGPYMAHTGSDPSLVSYRHSVGPPPLAWASTSPPVDPSRPLSGLVVVKRGGQALRAAARPRPAA